MRERTNLSDILTVTEVADILKIDPSRVRVLLRNSQLAGESKAGVWLIQRKAVEAYERARRPRAGGRPKKTLV